MTEENNLETYLSISPERYGIYLIDKHKLDILYQSEEKINDNLIDHNSLSKFLDNIQAPNFDMYFDNSWF